MNQLPTKSGNQGDQQRVLTQLYALMGKQVRSYHAHRHMGSNSSVPVELAQELMESIEYTVNLAGGAYAHENLEQALRFGQTILEEKVEKAGSLLELVRSTAPRWQTEYRWEALVYLGHFLEGYDHLHLAHRGPEGLYYPVLISPPEGGRGMDLCLFYLNILWIENQIMAGVPEEALEELWDRLPAGTVNQCEQVLINGLGKALLGTGLGSLVFGEEERMALGFLLIGEPEERLEEAARVLCRWLDLRDENARGYVRAAVSAVKMWAGDGALGMFL